MRRGNPERSKPALGGMRLKPAKKLLKRGSVTRAQADYLPVEAGRQHNFTAFICESWEPHLCVAPKSKKFLEPIL